MFNLRYRIKYYLEFLFQFAIYRIIFALLLLLIPYLVQAEMVQIPNIISAPIQVFDEGGNPVINGRYTITLSLKDRLGYVLYEEEHVTDIINSVTHVNLGGGFIPGTNLSAPTGGLYAELFEVDGDVIVEMRLNGSEFGQEITTLGSQPFAFIAQKAISVGDNGVDSSAIQNQSIEIEDLSPAALQELASLQDGDSGTIIFQADNIQMSGTKSFNYSTSANVEDVLKDLDTAVFGTNTNLEAHKSSANPHGITANSIGAASDDHNHDTVYLRQDGVYSMKGDFNMGGFSITNVHTVDGVDVSGVANQISQNQLNIEDLLDRIAILEDLAGI